MANFYDLTNTGPEVQDRLDQTQLNEQAIADLQEAVGTGGSVDTRIEAAKEEIIGNASTDFDTLGKVEGKVTTLEDAVGTGGSVDSRIEDAKEDVLSQVYTKDETYTKQQVNNLVTTPEVEYVTVTATDQTTDVTDLLPATGAEDTIYRVGKWDGTQYATTCYCEYAWDGTDYVMLDVKEYGIDNDPVADSDNLVESGGVYKTERVLGGKVDSIYRKFYFDANHLVDNNPPNPLVYKKNMNYDSAWVAVIDGSTKLKVTGATVRRFRFFSSFNVGDFATTQIDSNTSGEIPNGAVLAIVTFAKSDNPNGYNNLVIIQDNKFAYYNELKIPSRGVFVDYNHCFDTIENTYSYSPNWDSILLPICYNSQKVILENVTSGSYIQFNAPILDEEHYVGTNNTGEIIDSAKFLAIAMEKSSNPNGYDNVIVRWELNESAIVEKIEKGDRFASNGFYIDYNHLMNASTNNLDYRINHSWDCIIVVLDGQGRITFEGVNNSNWKYRFFDSLDIFSGENVMSKSLGYNVDGTVPEGAKVCVFNVKKSENPDGYDSIRLINDYSTDKANKKKIRFLSIGNSYSQDALAYVPFILQNMGIDVDIQIGIAMMSSSTLANHVSNFENETAAYKYHLYDGGDAWQTFDDKTLQYILDDKTWDIVCLQQSSGGVFNWSTYQPYLNKLINDISDYVDNPIKFCWYAVQARPAQSNGGENYSDTVIAEHFESICENAEKVMDETVCEFVVPVNTAIQNARSIATLKAMGDYANNQNNTSGLGYLTPNDGVHLQEGLPCQIAAYTFILKLLDIYSFDEFSINAESTRVTAEWAVGKNIPGPHGDYIGSTDENCLIAQKCAIMAIKKPYEMTDMNYIVNPS